MDASVIICTYNRAQSLIDTLNAIQQQETADSLTWEVIVVDNNSNDNTRQAIEEIQQKWPRLHYEFEPQQGLSHARNHGIQCAQGKVILFTDDDVIPETNWIECILQGLKNHQADACGGFIAPIWEAPPPAWLTERFHGFLAVRSERTDDYLITEVNQAPYGANMAFNKELLNKVGFFDINRGRKGNVLASGEDGELFERILNNGSKVIFLGNAKVHHKVESFRLTKKYMRRWRFQSSRNIALSRGITGERRFLNIPFFLFPQLLRAAMRMCWGYLTQAKDEAFNRDIIVFHFLGTMQGLYQSR